MSRLITKKAKAARGAVPVAEAVPHVPSGKLTDDLADASSPFVEDCELFAEVYETERWFPMVGWGKRRLPTDRPVWCSEIGGAAASPDDAVPAPNGCEWCGTWTAADWEYALDFQQAFAPKKSAKDCVRRRVWRRSFKVVDPAALHAPATRFVPGRLANAGKQRFECAADAEWDSGGQDAGTAVLEGGKLFLLATPDAVKALRVVELVDVAGTTSMHPLEAGHDHALTIDLDGRRNPAEAGRAITMRFPDAGAAERFAAELGRAATAARPIVEHRTITSIRRGASGLAADGLKLFAGSFASALGAGAGWRIGERAGNRASDRMGI